MRKTRKKKSETPREKKSKTPSESEILARDLREEMVSYLKENLDIGVDFIDHTIRLMAIGIAGGMNMSNEKTLVESLARLMRLRGRKLSEQKQNEFMKLLRERSA